MYVHVHVCVCISMSVCVCMYVCESPIMDHLTNDYNFKVSSVHYLEKRFVQYLSVHVFNICVHVLIFLYLTTQLLANTPPSFFPFISL